MGDRGLRKTRWVWLHARILGTVWILTGSLSCGSSSQTVTSPSATKCTVQAQPDRSAFPPAGGSGTVRITTNRECQWSVTTDAGWLSLANPRQGQGEGSVPFTIAANADPAARSAGIRINEEQVQVSQEGKPCEFGVSPRDEVVDASGGTRTIEVKPSSSACEWSAASDESWITITSGRQGKGDGTVTVRVDPIGSGSRTGTITIAGVAVRIEQRAEGAPGPGCTGLSIAPATIGVGAAGGAGDVQVTAAPGCAWRADSQAAWITIASGAAGTGTGIVSLRIAATDGPPRTGRVTVGSEVVTVEQSPGCTFAVDPTTYAAPAAGGASAITVTAGGGCVWSAASSVSWITITGGAGDTGSGRVDFAVAANSGPERSGTLTIAGREVAVRQAAGCSFAVNPTSYAAGAAGGPGTITVTAGAGCAWSAASSTSWISMAAAGGSGPGRAEFTVAANTGPERSATLTIAGHTIAVRQASGCTYAVTPTSHDAGGNGGTATVAVNTAAGCPWQTASGADWMTSQPRTATGSGQAQIAIQENLSPARTGTVTVAGQPVTVRQQSRCTYTILPPSLAYDARGGPGAALVVVSGPCTWTAVSRASWLVLDQSHAAGTGDGFVQFTVAPNTGGARTGTITIAGQTHTVTQTGSTP